MHLSSLAGARASVEHIALDAGHVSGHRKEIHLVIATHTRPLAAKNAPQGVKCRRESGHASRLLALPYSLRALGDLIDGLLPLQRL